MTLSRKIPCARADTPSLQPTDMDVDCHTPDTDEDVDMEPVATLYATSAWLDLPPVCRTHLVHATSSPPIPACQTQRTARQSIRQRTHAHASLNYSPQASTACPIMDTPFSEQLSQWAQDHCSEATHGDRVATIRYLHSRQPELWNGADLPLKVVQRAFLNCLVIVNPSAATAYEDAQGGYGSDTSDPPPGIKLSLAATARAPAGHAPAVATAAAASAAAAKRAPAAAISRAGVEGKTARATPPLNPAAERNVTAAPAVAVGHKAAAAAATSAAARKPSTKGNGPWQVMGPHNRPLPIAPASTLHSQPLAPGPNKPKARQRLAPPRHSPPQGSAARSPSVRIAMAASQGPTLPYWAGPTSKPATSAPTPTEGWGRTGQ